MSYSELKNIQTEALSFSEADCALYGELCGFPAAISDCSRQHAYTVTIFAKVPVTAEKETSAFINELAERLPKNAVKSQKSELNYLQVVFSSVQLFEETPLLLDFAESLGAFLREKGFAAAALDKKVCLPKGEKKQEKPEKSSDSSEPSMRFDRRSVYGLIGAVIGAVACFIIMGFAVQLSLSAEEAEPAVTSAENAAEEIIPQIEINNTGNIGTELVSWLFGGIVAAVILMDYRFFAKKTDIFGMVSCTLLTLASVFSGTILCGVRTLYSICGAAGIKTNLFMIMGNIDYYNGLFPEVGANLGYLLLKSLASAILASAVYYVWYFRKYPGVMYQKKPL